MQEECVSLPKSQTQLAQMDDDDDDDDVFATSIIDRYSACPDSLNNMCLATFAVNYNVCYSVSKDDDIIGIGEADEEEDIDNDDRFENQSNMQPMITLKQKLCYMRKRKQEAILRTRRYKISTEPEKYYNSKLLLYYPWTTESDIIARFNSYHESYISKQDTIHSNTYNFNDDCEVFDLSPEDIENNVPKSVWDSISPNIDNDDIHGFTTVQKLTEEVIPDINIALQDHDTHSKQDSLSRLYSKAANRKCISFQEYCTHSRSLNQQQC